jgi:hypothetical protein
MQEDIEMPQRAFKIQTRRAIGFLRAFLCCFLIAFHSAALADKPNITVTVSGSGATVDDAKSDAIRHALQQALRQLMVVDRVIDGDEIIRDRIMSTINGYIDAFRIKRIERAASGFVVEAEITVSPSRIENFIGLPIGGNGPIEGAKLLAEQDRRAAQTLAAKAQQNARGEILDRLFRGFPADDLALRVTEVTLPAEDSRILKIRFRYEYKPTFVNALTGTVEALAVHRCHASANTVEHGLDRAAILFTSRLSCETGREGATAGSDGELDVVCLRYPARTQCYQLLPGEYCASCDLVNFASTISQGYANQRKRLLIFGRFIDAAGRSAGRDCIIKQARPGIIRAFVAPYQSSKGVRRLVAGFDLTPGEGQIEISTGDVDLERAKTFVALAGVLRDDDWVSGGPTRLMNAAWVTSLVPENVRGDRAGCALLDDAVRYQMLSAAGAGGPMPQPANRGLAPRDPPPDPKGDRYAQAGSQLPKRQLQYSSQGVRMNLTNLAFDVPGMVGLRGEIVTKMTLTIENEREDPIYIAALGSMFHMDSVLTDNSGGACRASGATGISNTPRIQSGTSQITSWTTIPPRSRMNAVFTFPKCRISRTNLSFAGEFALSTNSSDARKLTVPLWGIEAIGVAPR